jgi:hypothetical protein
MFRTTALISYYHGVAQIIVESSKQLSREDDSALPKQNSTQTSLCRTALGAVPAAEILSIWSGVFGAA